MAQAALPLASGDSATAVISLRDIEKVYDSGELPFYALGGVSLEVSVRSVDDVTVTTTEPIAVRALSVTMDGAAIAQSLDLAAEFTATKKGDVIAYDLRRAEVKQGNISLASVTVAGEMKPGAKLSVSAKGNLAADLAALLGQPVLAPYATISRGKLTTVFEATIGDLIRAKAAVATQALTARQNNAALGDLDLSLNVEMKTDGGGTVTLPLTLVTGGRRSDLKLDGTFAHTAATTTFNGKISSDQLVADDFQALAALAALAPASPPEAKPAATPPRVPAKNPATRPSVAPVVTRDAAPVWKGVNGKVELDVKKILYGRDYAISGVRGTATITDARLALDGLEGKFKENPFKITAGVTFAEQRAQPYALTGDVNVTNLDLGEILRAANPNEKPAIETKVTVLAKLNGNGATLPDLAQNAYGQFDVSGSAGVLRGLGKKGEAVGVASSLLGLLGQAKGSNTTVAVAELTAQLNEMRFDKFTMRVDRGADLNLKLTALEFISAAMRVTGTGSITYQKGVPIDQQPLQVDVKLAGKDHMSLLLNKAGLLDGKQDEKGYATMSRAFSVSGTAAKPDSSQLWRIIGEAAARAAVGTFLR